MMKRISAVLLVIMFMISGCSHQLPMQPGLEAAATWTLVGDKVDSSMANHSPSLAFNQEGNPVVAFLQSCCNTDLYVKQWLNGQWRPLGRHLDVKRPKAAYRPSLAVDQLGRPVVAWHESAGASILSPPYDVYVKRWDGSAWVLLGGKLNVNTDRKFSSTYPSLAIDSPNRPVVAFTEGGNVYVKRWENESSWVLVGDALDVNVSNWAFLPHVAVDARDRIVVVWCEENELYNSNIYVKRWNGSRWVRLGTALDIDRSNNVSSPSLALSSDGVPYVAWTEINESNFLSVHVKRWDNTTWTSLGSSVNDIAAGQQGRSVSLTIRRFNKPVVTWEALTPLGNRALNVHRWNGSAWVGMGTRPVAYFHSSEVATTLDNVTMLAGAGLVTLQGQDALYVLRYE
jgi:hypothetical protein